ncbi:MAG: hypothetical protein N5P05_003625 [Chroococcopsis gigantea SAG 12.99]|nr:hypothetical protein [Chroococcopsis gigantea SAG 12.99]
MGDRCRLITILGIGGIGKTTLSVKLGRTIEEQFDYILWRNLREAPPIGDILGELILFLSQQKETNLSTTIGSQINKLLEYLSSYRCLLILDNLESIFQDGTHTGNYRPGYEDYGELFRQIGQIAHQSCLLLTSREKPADLINLEGNNSPVRTLHLEGLGRSAQQLFATKGLAISSDHCRYLIDLYHGNPLALNLVSARI